ncbi:helix-turn-helix domain-containing protein [Sphingobacterium sp. E70]|uniref:helix-turn-helix domain-containing protein n=1 Tax=Sphingobacterium sp. E70 TaxID=2853439 RepID=UPI00359C331F
MEKGFKERFGMGLFQFATQVHIQEAISLLRTTDLSIKEIAFRTGYSSPSSFSVAFKKQCGIAPNQIRKKSHTVHEEKLLLKGLIIDSDDFCSITSNRL